MIRQRAAYLCALSASEYWSLHKEDGYIAYCDTIDGNTRQVLSAQQDAESGRKTWSCTVMQKQNPIPANFRSLLGCEDFAFTITESWSPSTFSETHRETFVTVPAVLADKIHVSGAHWLEEESESACRLVFQLDVKVSISFVGNTLARALSSSLFAVYEKIPLRAQEFAALERQRRRNQAVVQQQAEAAAGAAEHEALVRSLLAKRRWRKAFLTFRFVRYATEMSEGSARNSVGSALAEATTAIAERSTRLLSGFFSRRYRNSRPRIWCDSSHAAAASASAECGPAETLVGTSAGEVIGTRAQVLAALYIQDWWRRTSCVPSSPATTSAAGGLAAGSGAGPRPEQTIRADDKVIEVEVVLILDDT